MNDEINDLNIIETGEFLQKKFVKNKDEFYSFLENYNLACLSRQTNWMIHNKLKDGFVVPIYSGTLHGDNYRLNYVDSEPVFLVVCPKELILKISKLNSFSLGEAT